MREVVAVAVEQRAPLGRQRHRAHPLRLTELHVAVAVEQLQLREPAGDEHEQQHDDDEHGDDPPALVAGRRPPRADARRRPAAGRVGEGRRLPAGTDRLGAAAILRRAG